MIVINHGKDWSKITYDSLAASNIALKSGMSVSIKPNLVVSRPASDGATTHPEVVEGIIQYLQDSGIRHINIIESSSIGDSTKKAFAVCGYEALQKKYNVSLIDLKNDSVIKHKHNGLEISICKTALETDFLINVPVLKSHCQTRMTCCLKNLKGCIPDSEKRRFHTIGLHSPIAALNALIKTHFCVVDGICGDLTFEEGGTPVEANRVIVGENPLMVDSFCAGLIGYQPEEIEHLQLARQMGVGQFVSPETKIIELNPDNKPLKAAKSNMIERYQRLVNEDSACSVCYSALIFALHRKGGRTNKKVHIGQGFKGKAGEGIGIGNCANGFSTCIEGCPPKAVDIMKQL